MFNFVGKIIDKFTNFSPIKRFINYALDKTFNEFLSNELKLEDFTNGELNLKNIDVNVEKVNSVHLLSSPYILHSGKIGLLKIKLPSLSEISTKSIEINITKLQIEMKPNKHFASTFQNIMKERAEEDAYYVKEKFEEKEISENGPMDFFKQLLKQIVLNIRISFEDTTVKLFMREPSKEIKLQYYLLLRIPKIEAGKSEDYCKEDADIEEIKFSLKISQISLHLFKDGDEKNQTNFPFTFLTVNHPSTILLIGSKEQQKGNETILKLHMLSNFKTTKKLMTIKIAVINIESMVDALQLKILSRLSNQIEEFKDVRRCVFKDLGLNEVKAQQSVRKSPGSSRFSTNDFFSSMMMSFRESSSNFEEDIYSKMIKISSELEEVAQEFNASFQRVVEEEKIVTNKEIAQNFRNIKFTEEFNLKFNILFCHIYVLKKCVTKDRLWMIDEKIEKVNAKIDCGHFMVKTHELKLSFYKSSSVLSLSLEEIKVYNVLIAESTFESVREVNDSFHEKNLKHNCIEEIIRINKKPEKEVKTDTLKEYIFLPVCERKKNNNDTFYKYGLTLSFNQKEKKVKINIEEIFIAISIKLCHEIFLVLNPIEEIAIIAEEAALLNNYLIHNEEKNNSNVKEQPENIKENENKKTMLASQYELSPLKGGEYNFKEPSDLSIAIRVELINLSIRECFSIENELDVSEIEEEETCFCKTNAKSLYIEIFELEVIKKYQSIMTSIFKIEAGLFSITNSLILQDKFSSFLKIISINDSPAIRFFIEKNLDKNKKQIDLISLYTESCNLHINKILLFELLETVKRISKGIQRVIIEVLETANSSANFTLKKKKPTKKYQEKIPKTLQVYSAETNINLLEIEIHTKSLFFIQTEDNIQCKINTIIVALSNIKNIALGVFDINHLESTENKAIFVTKTILKHEIILSIISEQEISIVFKPKERNNFFTYIKEQKHSIELKIEKSNERAVEEKIYQREGRLMFPTSNKAVNIPIPEINTIQHIEIKFYNEINVIATNALSLIEEKEEIEMILRKILTVKKNVENESEFFLPKHKESFIGEYEESTEFKIYVGKGRINIDIWPDFVNKKLSNYRIMSNTRSIVCLLWDSIKTSLHSESKNMNIETECALEFYFVLNKTMNEVLNPFCINSKHYDSLGFKNIVNLRAARIMVQQNSLKKILHISIYCEEVNLSFSVMSIALFNTHFEHFFKHHIEKNYGLTTEESDEIFDDISRENEKIVMEEKEFERHMAESMEVEDISYAYELFSKKIDEKENCEAEFKQRDYICMVNNPNFTIEKLTIKSMRFKVFFENEYNFKENTRERENNYIEKLNYICFFAENTILKLEKNEDIVEMHLQSERIELLNIKSKTKTGFLTNIISDKCDEQIIFPFLKCDLPLKFLFQKSKEYKKIKCNKIEMNIGYSSDITKILQKMKESEAEEENNGWRKKYEEKIKFLKVKENWLLLIIPEGKIYLTIEYFNKKLISNQFVELKEFTLHEDIYNTLRIKSIIVDWVKGVLKNNLSNLVSGAAVSILSQSINSLIEAISYILFLMLPVKK